jgi:hypothetical protein
LYPNGGMCPSSRDGTGYNSDRPFPTVLVSTRAPRSSTQTVCGSPTSLRRRRLCGRPAKLIAPPSLAHNHHQPPHEPNPIHTLAPSRARQSCVTISSTRSRCRTCHHYTTLPIILHIPTGTATPPRSTPRAMPVLMLTRHTDTTQAMPMHACTPHRSHHRTVRRCTRGRPQNTRGRLPRMQHSGKAYRGSGSRGRGLP